MSKEEDEFTAFWGEPISVYDSKMAEADGILIAVKHPFINYITHSVFESCIYPYVMDGDKSQTDKLVSNLIHQVILEIKKQYQKANKKMDWFYEVIVKDFKSNDCRLFVAQNETGKYTIMRPSDY
jgi:hypothetical protein